MILLLLAAVASGAALHRLTGMGFALVAAPMLVLILGASTGVIVVNLCSSVSSAMVLARLWRDVEAKMFRKPLVAGVVGVVPGAWLAANLAGPWLQICFGALLACALLLSLLVTRLKTTVRGRTAPYIAGFMSGGMSAAVGLGGPPLSTYAVLSRWNQASFAATIQPIILVTGLLAIAVKLQIAPGRAPSLDWWVWVSIILALASGHILGNRLAAVISAQWARAGVVAISFAGALVAIGTGLDHLVR